MTDTPKKRAPKAGTRRVMVTMTESEYAVLVKAAETEMREPNNMLSFLLKDQFASLLEPYTKVQLQ